MADWIRGERSVLVAAAPERCFVVVADVDAYPEWQAMVREVRVLERDEAGRARVAETVAVTEVRTVRYAMRYAYEPPHRISWRQVQGDLRDLEGEYALERARRGGRDPRHLPPGSPSGRPPCAAHALPALPAGRPVVHAPGARRGPRPLRGAGARCPLTTPGSFPQRSRDISRLGRLRQAKAAGRRSPRARCSSLWFGYGTLVTSLDPNREIYPNAPLKLVAFELRFPEVPELLDAQPALDQRLRKRLPLLGPPPVGEMRVEMAGGAAPRVVPRQGGVRRLDRRRRHGVAITPNGITVETSQYTRFEEFRVVIEELLGHLGDTVELPAVERVGIRYIDEIDPVDLPQPVSWADYIAPELLHVSGFFGYEPIETNTIAVFAPSNEQQLVLRYGVAQAPVVNPGGPLYIARSPQNPYFLIDIDSGWNAPADDLPEFVVAEVLGVLDRLHAPVREVFERMITDKLREHFKAPREDHS